MADRKLVQAIHMELDKIGANGGLTTLAAVRDKIRVTCPARHWHPADLIDAERDFLGKLVKQVMLEPLSKEYIYENLPELDPKYRNFLAKKPSWFYVPSIKQWAFALRADPAHWDQGREMREEMAQSITENAEEFKETADMLRMAGVKSLLELLLKSAPKKKAPKEIENRLTSR